MLNLSCGMKTIHTYTAGSIILAMTLLMPQIVAKQPNIVFFLTDDQDQMLGGSFPPTAPGGATPMPKTKDLFQTGGSTATNFFIHTPICCPSRAETVTGRYIAYRIERVHTHQILRLIHPIPFSGCRHIFHITLPSPRALVIHTITLPPHSFRRYLHNVHTPPAAKQCDSAYSGHDDKGNACCMHVDEVLVNNVTMATFLEKKGCVPVCSVLQSHKFPRLNVLLCTII